MPLGSNHVTLTNVSSGAATRTRSNSAFIPELWVDEVLSAFKSNLVLANLAVPWSFEGTKGDTVHIPVMERYSGTDRLEGRYRCNVR